jgi:hemerythrin-like domain-containing protein
MNLKKIIYILFSLLIGFVLYCITYAEYEYEFRLNMIENSLKDNKYDEIAMIYETFFDSKSKVEDNSDKTDFMIYPSTFQTAIQYSDGINHIDYEKAYSFYLFNNNFSLESHDKKNKSAIRFITDSGYYDFYFVVNTGINTEILIPDPATIEEALINVGRDYPINNRELGFINITFTETMLEGITKLANGKDGTGNINKIELLDTYGQVVLEHSITFDFSYQFFIDNEKMINSFNEVYQKYKETDDPFEQEKIEEDFNKMLEDWTAKFKESNHPTYRLGYSEDELTSKSFFTKTIVIMIIYVIVDILLYILLFYWQSIMDLIIKIFKLKAPAGWEYREKK